MKLRKLLTLKADEIIDYFDSYQPKEDVKVPYNIELREIYTNPPDNYKFRKANVVKKTGYAVFYTITASYRDRRLRKTVFKRILLVGPYREITVYFDNNEKVSGIQDKKKYGYRG